MSVSKKGAVRQKVDDSKRVKKMKKLEEAVEIVNDVLGKVSKCNSYENIMQEVLNPLRKLTPANQGGYAFANEVIKCMKRTIPVSLDESNVGKVIAEFDSVKKCINDNPTQKLIQQLGLPRLR